MTDTMRWRYGDTNPVVLAVDSATNVAVSPGLGSAGVGIYHLATQSGAMLTLDGGPYEHPAIDHEDRAAGKWSCLEAEASPSSMAGAAPAATVGVPATVGQGSPASRLNAA